MKQKRTVNHIVNPQIRQRKTVIISSGALLVVSLFSLLFFSIESSVSWHSLTADSPHSACESDTLRGSLTIGSGATDISLVLSLAPGVSYIPMSASFSGGATLVSEDLTDLSNPVFELTNPTGQIDFFLARRTDCESYLSQISGGLLVDTARVYEAGIQISGDYLTNQYALDYGVLSMGAATTTPSSALLGETVTRSVTITNGNFGAIDTFWFAEIFEADQLVVDSFRINPSSSDYLISPGNIIESSLSDSFYLQLGPAEIRQFGDGDSLFENGESFELSYRLTLNGCGSGTTISSTPTVWWGCGGSFCQQYQQSAGVSLTQAEPDLGYTIDVLESGCIGYGSLPDTVVVEITNSGAGPATEIEFGFQSKEKRFGGFDSDNVKYRVAGGEKQSVAVTDLTNPVNDVLQCASDWTSAGALYSNGKVFLDVILPPGESMEVFFLSYNCCPSVCLDPEKLPDNSTYFGTTYRVDSYFKFKNQCRLNEQDLGPGSLDTRKMSVAYSIYSPPNLFDGAASTYAYLDFTELLVSDLFTDLSNVTFELSIDFPRCVELGGNASSLEWVDKDGVSVFSPVSTTQTDSTITVIWDPSTMDASGTSLNLSGTQIRFPIQSDCSEGNCEFTGVEINFTVKPDVSCTGCELKWICESVPVDILCPSVCPNGGGQLLRSIFERENLGAPDGDNNGCPDDDNDCDGTGASSSQSFNAGLVRRERALAGDTIISQVSGVILDGAIASTWQYLFFENQLNDADLMDIIEAEMRFVDVSAGNTTYTTNRLVPAKFGDTVRLDMSIPAISTQLGLPGSVTHYEDGDTIEVTIRYRLNGNLSDVTENITTSNSLYTSTVSAPSVSERYACATTRGVLIAGNPGNSTYKSWITFPSGCASKNIGFNTEIKLDGSATGNNFFPFEYRIWAKPERYIVTIPIGYQFDRVRLAHKRTTGNGTSSSLNYTDPIHATDSLTYSDGATTYTFDITDPLNVGIWAENGGNYFYGDDGAFFRFFAEASPGCASPDSWKSDDEGGDAYLQIHEFINVLGETHERTGSTNLFFTKPSVTTSSSVPLQEGVYSEVEWEASISNLSSNISVENAWIALVSPNENIGSGLLELYDEADQLMSPAANGLYELGSLGKNVTETFRVKADYSTCELDSLLFLVGWDCEGYPQSLATYSCTPDTVVLYVEPVQGQVSVVVTDLASTPTDPTDGSSTAYGEDSIRLCEVFPVEFRINSALPGALDEVFALMDVPVSSGEGGIEFVDGSGYFEYPIGSTPKPFTSVANEALKAQNGGAQFLFDWSQIGGSDLPTSYELPGVYEAAPERAVILRFNMKANCSLPVGDVFNIRAFATYGCGAAAIGFGENLSGDQLAVSGVIPDYQTLITVGALDTFTNFSTTQNVRITLEKSGTNPIANGDSVILRLPKGLTFSGWGGCISGPCPDPAGLKTYQVDGQEFHAWPMAAMNDGQIAEFELELMLDENVYGQLGLVEVQTRNQQFIGCATEPSGLCSTPGVVLSGSGTRAISAYLPSVVVDISNLIANQFDDSIFTYTATITLFTAEEDAPDGFWAELYCGDPDRQISTGEAPADSVFFPGPIVAGSILDTTISFLADCDPLTKGILVMIPDTIFNGNKTQGFNPVIGGLNRGGTSTGGNPYDFATTGMVTFPLEWISVTARQDGNKALIRWEVAQDMVIDHYEIDRQTPGQMFEKVASENLKEGTVASYEWKDKQLPQSGNILYRIRAIDPNGQQLISPTVELSSEAYDLSLTILENPVTDLLSVQFALPETGGTIKVWNLQGQIIQTETLDGSDTAWETPVNTWATGIYVVSLSTDRGIESTKLEVR